MSEDDKKTKKKWEYAIHSWLGLRRLGKWVPEHILTKTKRVFERHTHSAESTRSKPVIVKQVVEEFIHLSGGYRPFFEDEKKARKAFFFRGARVWRG